MLRKALGELARASRTKRTVTLGGILLLLLGVITVGVALAADPNVDGDIGGDPAWQSSDIVRTDPEDATIPDRYDIEDVYMRSSDDNLTLFCGFEVYTDSIVMNDGADVFIGFDLDHNSATGGEIAEGACPNIGAEYRAWYYYSGRPLYVWYEDVDKWDGSQFAPHAYGLGSHDPDYEMAMEYGAIGLTETVCISIGIHFENVAAPDDDSVCDITWCYTDGTTAVDLSSFTAHSGGTVDGAMSPAMLALLGLGLSLVATGGLVLWRGRSLAG